MNFVLVKKKTKHANSSAAWCPWHSQGCLQQKQTHSPHFHSCKRKNITCLQMRRINDELLRPH